jgi:branched-chain amino acid aminotransferase
VLISVAMDLPIELRPTRTPMSVAERAKLMEDLGFGRIFSEHMVTVRYEQGRFSSAALVPYAPISLAPAASSLHYGQAIFEGFKAYRQPDGGIATFRPDANARRFNASARRLAMPEMPIELFVGAADALIRQDAEWVPSKDGESMYLRPLMIATEPALGVRAAKEYLFLVFGSPSSSYFPRGVKPVTVWICDDFVRASPGGTGAAKCAGNYAASLVAQQQAAERGCDQVVWLDACSRSVIEEMGGMNLFFVYREGEKIKLVTPELTGALLPGITRESLLTLGKELGYETAEGRITVDEWYQGVESGRIVEAFACGTAAVITPVGTVKSPRGELSINRGETGPVASRLREALLDVQYGRAPDRHGWLHRVV